MGVLIKQSLATAFNPLSIAWHSAYWAEDPAWTNPGTGNPITTWTDASGNARSVTQATPGKRPLYQASSINGKPAVQFDGVDDNLTSASAFAVTAGTITKVIIFKLESYSGGNNHYWSTGDASSDRADLYRVATNWAMYGSATTGGGTINVTSGTIADLNTHLEIATFGASSSIEIDGSSVATGTGAAALANHSLGSYNAGEYSAVNIAFAGLFVGTLSQQNKDSLRAWSHTTYGTP